MDNNPIKPTSATSALMRDEINPWIIKDSSSPNNWSSDSHDCYSCAFYLFGVVGWDTNRAKGNTVAELKQRIIKIFSELTTDQVEHTRNRFRSSLEKVIATEGACFDKSPKQ